MNQFIFAILSVVSISASAELKPQGTVRSDRCASWIGQFDVDPTVIVNPPGRVCWVDVIGQPGQNFLSVDNDVWAVIGSSGMNLTLQKIGTVGPSGQLQYFTNSESITAKAFHDRSGITLILSQQTVRAERFVLSESHSSRGVLK